MGKQNDYKSFLLRLRRMQNDSNPTWVVSLQNLQTGQQVYFPQLDQLIHFLETETGRDIDLKINDQPVAVNLETDE